MQRRIDVAPSIRLWVQEFGDPTASPVVLVAGAGMDCRQWPGRLLGALAARHRIIRFDHRDTGRSDAGGTYGMAQLAADVVTILDALDVDRAHVLGISLGGKVVQILMLDHPERLRGATLLCSAPLPARAEDRDTALRRVPSRLRALWRRLDTERDDATRTALMLEERRLLYGASLPFDERAHRILLAYRRIDTIYGREHPHRRVDADAPLRGHELAHVRVPTLVVGGTDDPVNPWPVSCELRDALGDARLAAMPGMGHLLHPSVIDRLAGVVLDHAARCADGA